MVATNDRGDEEPIPTGPWSDRVEYAGRAGVAYRPGEVCTTGGDAAAEVARAVAPEMRREEREVGPFIRLTNVPDPLRLVEELRLRGFAAQPNHVFFADCDCGCPPHPAAAGGGVAGSPVYASPVYASPVYASPVYASPVYASPVYASPVYASPVYASPTSAYRTSGVRRSSARPAVEDESVAGHLKAEGTKGTARIFILDTGLAVEKDIRPHALDKDRITTGGPADQEVPDIDGDELLDPAAGHGTFIAGIVDQVASGCEMKLHRVISNYGDGDEWVIARCLEDVAAGCDEHTILNLSFGGRALDRPELLASAVRGVQATGAVVVASAGNDGVCHPTFPAALPDVVGVGAIGPAGPAPFSNYGPWVRACAPGVDVLSTFFHFEGAEPAPSGGADPDDFAGWAHWSGTSFAAPVVVGALARTMAATGCTAGDAVTRVVDNPSLMRIPNLGTVVNLL
jgi:hypothetical protein